ncbi:phosphatidylinositol kinase [Bacteroidia bacterium]|nr:phosphatidylinositol kinase [Bacteroidia bacterium]
MRGARVYVNGNLCGKLIEDDKKEYVFTYETHYFNDTDAPAISLTLPKIAQEHRSKTLFSFFYNLLSEGENRELNLPYRKVERDDVFGFLIRTTGNDTIGAVTLQEIKDAGLW